MIRYNESENNVKNHHLVTARPRLPKNEFTPQKSGRFLTSIEFDKIYASYLPLTVMIYENTLPDYEYEKLPLIRKVNDGTLTDPPVQNYIDEYVDFYINHRVVYNFTPWNGENCEMTCVRAKNF